MKQEWIDYFYGMAEYAASKSRDPSTKVGAVAFRPDKSIASTGFNGFPQGTSDSPSLYADRDAKISRVNHAEGNAIDFAAKHGTALNGCGIAVNFHPCSHCAGRIINAGIVTVICPPIPSETKWLESFKVARDLFMQAGVEIIYREPECLTINTR